MSKIRIIAFDADDTLWHNEHLYSDAKEQFRILMSAYEPQADAAARLDEIEEHNVGIYGYGIKSFTLSMLETAAEISDGKIPSEEIEAILDLGKAMHNAPVELFDQTQAVLVELAKTYPLMLITKGDTFEQQRKVERSGLAGYFKYIEIVASKTPEAYQRLFTQHHIDPINVLMVGNSLRSDILPVLEIGGLAVYIHYENTWSHEHVDEETLAKYHYYEVEHIGKVPELVEGLNGG